MFPLVLACATPQPAAHRPDRSDDVTVPPAPTPGPEPATIPTTPADPALRVGALVFEDGVPPTNLLVISLDTMRRDHVGRFSGTGLTPNLDAVLADAFVLEDHRSCSNWTAPSMTCVVSGRTPMENGFWPWCTDPAVGNRPGPAYAGRTLAGLLGANGYRTSLVSANVVFSDWLGVAEGFGRQTVIDSAPAQDVAATALGELEVMTGLGDPWYLHVHFIDPHGNYCAPAAFVDTAELVDLGYTTEEWCGDTYGLGDTWWSRPPEGRDAVVDTLLALYAGEILYWDATFGQMWAELDASGALDDALVVFVTDHGQQFFERGGHGHGIVLGAEENRSTAAFWARNLTPAAWTEETVHQDVAATIHAVFGLVPDVPITGTTVGTAATDRAVRAQNYWGEVVELSVARDGHQLLYAWNGDRAWYDLTVDPAGLVDTYDPTNPDLVALWGDLGTWIDDVRAAWPHLPAPTAPGP